MISSETLLTDQVIAGRYRIACGRHGPENGSPVILMHGTPAHSIIWRDVVPALTAAGFRVHVFDLLGYGVSERPLHADTSVTGQEEVLAAMMVQWELDDAHIVGHDISGAIGLRSVVHAPERVRSLTIIDSCSYDSWPSETWAAIIENEFRIHSEMSEADFRDLMVGQLKTAIHDPARMSGALLDAYLAPFTGALGRLSYFTHQMAHYDSRHTEEITPQLGAIERPVHIVWGAEDRWQPVTWAERLSGDIPQARLTIIPGAGHFAMEDEPGRVADALLSFLERQENGEKP